MDLVDSATRLRQSLGDHLTTIRRLDPLRTERDRTRTFRRGLVSRYGSICGYCGADGDVETAHIVPLEIGGQTEESNLILLCKQCHHLYDTGHVSINTMSDVATRWRRRTPSSFTGSPICPQERPAPTITLPPRAVAELFDKLLELQRERKFAKAVKLIELTLSDSAIGGPARTYLQIKRAELTRRRSARGAVEEALGYLEEIDRKRVPDRYLAVFYYELNYVQRLLGNHLAAAQAARQSAEASLRRSGETRPGVDYVAAKANEILCEVAASEALSTSRAREFESRLSKIEKISAESGAYWGGRWALNCGAHALQVRMKAGDGPTSWTALKRVRKIYFDSDVSRGWDAGGYQTISQLDGLVNVMFSRDKADVARGIGLLARSFVTRIGCRQRPEGVRDVGFGLAMGLRKSANREMRRVADAVEGLMHRTVDGTSVLWSWRAHH